MSQSSHAADTVPVHVLSLPVPLWRDTAIHHEAVNREFEILRAGFDEDAAPNRLHRLVIELEGRFGDLSGPNREILEEAAARGDEHVDLVFDIPSAAAGAIREVSALLDAVDEFCNERDELLSLAASEEMVRFRRWFLAEFNRQIEDGLPPTPWPDAAGVPSHLQGGGDVVRFDGELDISTADSLRERLLRGRTDGSSDVIVDLSRITFVDSVGLSLLVMAHTSFEAEKRNLRVVLPNALRPLIELSGLGDVLDVTFVGDASG